MCDVRGPEQVQRAGCDGNYLRQRPRCSDGKASQDRKNKKTHAARSGGRTADPRLHTACCSTVARTACSNSESSYPPNQRSPSGPARPRLSPGHVAAAAGARFPACAHCAASPMHSGGEARRGITWLARLGVNRAGRLGVPVARVVVAPRRALLGVRALAPQVGHGRAVAPQLVGVAPVIVVVVNYRSRRQARQASAHQPREVCLLWSWERLHRRGRTHSSAVRCDGRGRAGCGPAWPSRRPICRTWRFGNQPLRAWSPHPSCSGALLQTPPILRGGSPRGSLRCYWNGCYAGVHHPGRGRTCEAAHRICRVVDLHRSVDRVDVIRCSNPRAGWRQRADSMPVSEWHCAEASIRHPRG